MGKEEAREKIKLLVDKYNRIVVEKRIGKYNEEMTKKEFIEPLFEALGWDIRNTYNDDEVTTEEKISSKRVDYGFRINGIPKFFLEAKPLKADLDKIEYVDQAINYAWHKGCTWAILTDFESIKIFNAEWKSSNPLQTQFGQTLKCHQFLQYFDQLWLLSKESFQQGLLDKEAEKWGKKAKKTSVDKQLLSDFTRFRELLSKNASKLNQSTNLSEIELDEAIQLLLDRLIFIRNCEDRGLEAKTLLPAFREWQSQGKGQLVKKLREVFTHFDELYNSKIFAKHLCDDLQLDDEVLSEIINGLYTTKDNSVHYDFSAIEADVLGNIYEQYLGHILKKTEKRAKLTESQAHRKEQGIYYTPTYIVDYIVKNTLGELLKNKKVDPEKIRILDPACGSGSFLIKAFDTINQYFTKKDKNYAQTKLDSTGQGATYSRKMKILQNNIFGVDLDKQAVEVAQLNLLLKIAEKGHRLPLLQENIKCGNSLIDDSEVAGDKAFKWQEQFPEVMKEGGFDVVIGNPPWVQSKFLPSQDKAYYEKSYKVAKKQYDTFTIFIERALDRLKENGILGFIVPDRFLTNLDYLPIRNLLLTNCRILQLIHLGDDVFPEVNMPSAIMIIQKDSDTSRRQNQKIKYGQRNGESLISIDYNEKIQKEFSKNDELIFSIFEQKGISSIIKKMQKDSVQFHEVVANARGVEIGKKSKLVSGSRIGDWCVPFLVGEDIDRYGINSQHYLKLGDSNVDYKDSSLYSGPKILIRKTGSGIRAVLDEQNRYVIQVIYIFKIKSEQVVPAYLLGILNSKLMAAYYFSVFGGKNRKTFPHLTQGKVLQLPIKIVISSQQQPIIKLVDKMLTLKKRLNEIGDKKIDERARIEEEIKKIDSEIDELVYKIYDITDEEKKIIEESLK